MTDIFSVQYLQSLQNLARDLASLGFGFLMVLNILTQIPVLDILHCQEDVAVVFVPAKELDEQVFMLDILR